MLGSFEEMVLLALVHQGDRAYAVSIRRELAERSGSEVTMGSVYGTLDRLEGKGFIAGREGGPRASRRGRPRRYYDILPAGVSALDESKRVRESMWQGVDLSRLETGEAG